MFQYIPQQKIMFQYFRGCWKFTREIKSLVDDRYMAVAIDAIASFCPWRDQSATEHSISTPVESSTDLQWLLYRETGCLENLESKSGSLDFNRQYLYKFCEGVKLVEAFHCRKLPSTSKEDLHPSNLTFNQSSFIENGFFHNLALLPLKNLENFETLIAEGDHPCGRDMYKVRYEIISPDNYRTVWKVNGPEKSFQIITSYMKCKDS